jgi:hypothetical protein
MQIILEKDEYINLRPNRLNEQLIGKIREHLASNEHWEFKLDRIKNEFEDYDKKIKRKPENDYPLW